jgi:hypothetical protein
MGGDLMNPLNMTAITLVIAGGLGLAYGSYSEEPLEARLGLIELTIQDRHTASAPVWFGVAAIVAGMILLIMPKDI